MLSLKPQPEKDLVSFEQGVNVIEVQRALISSLSSWTQLLRGDEFAGIFLLTAWIQEPLTLL